MNSVIKSKGGIISLKKKYYNQFLTKNDNNNINVLNSVNIPYSFNNYQCMCVCHEEKAMNNNNLYNYNSEIINSYISDSNLDKRQYQKILLGRNRSANYLLALKNKDLSLDPSKVYSTNYNYNFNYFDNVGNGILKKKPKSQEKMNNLYQNEKINININQTDNVEKTDNLQKIDSMNEIKNNLSKSSIVHKNENENENKSVNEADINKNILYRSYHDAKPSKYSYGGRTIIVSSNAKNHTFKEIIVKSGSSDKILNKKKFIKLTENNIYNNINNNYNEKNCYKSNNNTEINNDINYNFNTDENKNENNNNINHREIKKSTSDNYLFNHHHIHHIHRCRCHCINHMNYFRDISNCNQNNDIHLMANNKDKYKLNIYDYCKNDNLLTCEKENKNNNNNIYEPIQILNYDNNNKYHIPTEVFNSENSEIFNKCNNNKYNYNYNLNGQNYYYKNKKTIPKSNSFDNYNILKKTYKNTIVTPKNSAIWDFNYNNFKLKVKLGLLKNEIYKNEKNNKNGNKNRIKLNYQQDKKYLENILNNKKKSNIKDIVLEKTKKALEEKKLKQENKYNNNKNQKNYKYRYKDENQILSNLKKQLLENNKKNNKYIVKPKLNVFK